MNDEMLRERLRDALAPPDLMPPPEMYDELMACGCWPLVVSKEQAEEYWVRRRAEVAKR